MEENDNLNPQTAKDMEAISNGLSCMKEYGLEVECLYFAMLELKNNTNTTIEEAINYGIGEWIK